MCKHRVNSILCALLCTVAVSAICTSCGNKEASFDSSASIASTSSATASLSSSKQSSSEQSSSSSEDTSSFSVDEALNELAEMKARSEFEEQYQSDMEVWNNEMDSSLSSLENESENYDWNFLDPSRDSSSSSN